jgi:hypothetical protein
VLAIDCEGPKGTGPAFDGVFHYLNLQPVLELAINRYTDELCESTGLAVALEWFVHHPRYAELQLISASTALEHLIVSFVKKHGAPRIVPLELFEELAAKMKSVCQEAMRDAEEPRRRAIERLRNKLAQINDGSLKDKLESLIETYGVPLAGLDIKQISDAITARNLVVHRGLYRSESESEGIQQHVAVLRELLKRIFLVLLRYEGEYFSLLTGPQWVHFPPAPQT